MSEQFSRFCGRVILGFLLIAIVCFLVLPSFHVAADSAGTVNVATKEVQVFNAQSTTATGAVLPDFGFGANYLSFCTSSFIGTIDLGWIPPGTVTRIILQQAFFGTNAPSTHCYGPGSGGLQIGGYYPNLTSRVTITQGTISAWYSASSAPISAFPPSLGSNGPSSPIACDQTFVAAIANTATAAVIGSATGTSTTIICGMTISYFGATVAGSVAIIWSASSACTSTTPGWSAYTTSGTPQTVSLLAGFTQQDPLGPASASARQTPCFQNNSGSAALVAVSFAEVPNL